MKLFILLIAITVIVYITYTIVKAIKKNRAEKEKRLEKELKEQEWQKTYQERRNIYYNSLPNIYNNLSTQTLRQAYKLLDNMIYYRPISNNRTFAPLDKESCMAWHEEKEKFLALINPNGRYLWKDISNSMNDPLWYDLDWKYVKNLLHRR